MAKPKFFKTTTGLQIPLPVFFPDATRAVLKSLDSTDIESTKTPGILVNTFHLFTQPGIKIMEQFNGIRNFMNWNGAVISDSGGFQVMSLAKKFNGNNPVTDQGVNFPLPGTSKKILFTPQSSIDMQIALKTDMIVVLDDFTDINATAVQERVTVERTINWAKECKKVFEKKFSMTDPVDRPYLLGVVQGGHNLELRRECTERLVEIGFDGLGWGGWPINNGQIDFSSADVIQKNTPENYLLYGLGVGKPEDIVRLVHTGWNVFDCVLPTRDARHRRLYIYNADSVDNIDIHQSNLYSFYSPDRATLAGSQQPVSIACDCLLCTGYTRGYLRHLFQIGDMTAGRLATIHNLRFYSLLMEKLRSVYEQL